MNKTADEKTGTCEKQDCESDLPDDQRLTQSEPDTTHDPSGCH